MVPDRVRCTASIAHRATLRTCRTSWSQSKCSLNTEETDRRNEQGTHALGGRREVPGAGTIGDVLQPAGGVDDIEASIAADRSALFNSADQSVLMLLKYG